MSGSDIRTFARLQVQSRLEKLDSELARVAAEPSAAAVHDFRVAVRRFTQGLIIFRSLLPEDSAQGMRKRLRKLMKLAGEVRDRDIALEFLKESGLDGRDALWKHLERDRQESEARLAKKARRWSEAGRVRAWGDKLAPVPK
jgi:CHAD domain-containing protein